MGKLMRGEYDSVVLWSINREALRVVHSTPIDQEGTRKLVYQVVQDFNLPMVTLRFGHKNGLTTRDKDHNNNVRISLPRDPMVPGGTPYGYLRVGLVLHELAHVMTPIGVHHGPQFTQALDNLISYWYKGGRDMSMDWDSYESQILAYSNEISKLELQLEEFKRARARLQMEQAKFTAPPVQVVPSKGPKPPAPVMMRCADCDGKTRNRVVRNGFEIALCLMCQTSMELEAKLAARSSNGSGAEQNVARRD